MVRIIAHPRYPMPEVAGYPARAADLLKRLQEMRGHVFWHDDFSLVAEPSVDLLTVTKSGDLTDTYLLALAVRHSGSLATFDRRLRTAAVRGGADALHVIPTA